MLAFLSVMNKARKPRSVCSGMVCAACHSLSYSHKRGAFWSCAETVTEMLSSDRFLVMLAVSRVSHQDSAIEGSVLMYCRGLVHTASKQSWGCFN